jgi:hypothetical protein
MSDQGSDGARQGSTTSGTETRDWTYEVADKVEGVVGAVKQKTTIPIAKIARGIVFGMIAATLGLVALIILIIVVLRLIDVYLPFDPYGRRVWVGYAGLGAIFVVAGAFCWSKRTASKS